MAITSLAELRNAYESAPKISAYKIYDFGGEVNRNYGMIWDSFRAAGYPTIGAVPAVLAGTQHDKNTTGAIQLNGTVSGSLYALADVQASVFFNPRLEASLSSYAFAGGSEFYVHIWDRIWTNIVNGATASRQSWTFPTLTRYTTGEGLSIWFRIWGPHNIINTNITLEYKNQNGVSKTLTTFQYVQSLLYYHTPAIMPLPLSVGDSGVRSIDAITFGSPSAAANAVGLCLMRYLGSYRVNATSIQEATSPTSFLAGLPQFDGNACLTLGVQVGSPVTINSLLGPLTTMPRIAFEAKVIPI